MRGMNLDELKSRDEGSACGCFKCFRIGVDSRQVQGESGGRVLERNRASEQPLASRPARRLRSSCAAQGRSWLALRPASNRTS